jgi:tRNA nucleotidyltransferase/poly(A) polymerase
MKDETSHPLESNSSYAGRWVARVRGRIIAQGGSPELALRASQGTRHKEKPEIVYMPTPFSLPPLVEKVWSVASDEKLHLVGGAVRDILLGRVPPDLDFALPANGISVARKVANALHADFMRLDDERDTGRVIVTNEDGTRTFLDFAAYRGADLEWDLRGRDFTVNAIAFDLAASAIIDPLDGLQDLHARLLKACSNKSFLDDPVRILRGVRQAAAFGFHIDKGTRELMKQASAELGRVSVERLRDELFKILEGPEPHASIRALEMLGIFPHFLPELIPLKGVEQSLPHVHDVWEHTLAVLESLEKLMALLFNENAQQNEEMALDTFAARMEKYRERFQKHFEHSLHTERSLRPLFFFAALYHDTGKPQTKTLDEAGITHFYEHEDVGAEITAQRGRGLNLSNDEVNWLYTVVKNHMRIHSLAIRLQKDGKMPSRRAMYRFFRDSGEAGVDLTLLVLADTRGMRGDTLTREIWAGYLDICMQLLENYWERPEEVVAPPRLLDGRDLMKEFDLEPGPLVGQLLEAIRENQAMGQISTRGQALAFARNKLTKGNAGSQ